MRVKSLYNVGNVDDDFWDVFMDPNTFKTNLFNCCKGDMSGDKCLLNDKIRITRNQCDDEMKKFCSVDTNKSLPICGCYNVPPKKIRK